MNQVITLTWLCLLYLMVTTNTCHGGSIDKRGIFEDHLNGKLDALEKKLGKEIAKLSALNEEISGLKEENTVLKGQISVLEGQFSGLEGQNLNDEISALKDEIAGLKEENTVVEGQIFALEDADKKHVENIEKLDEHDKKQEELEHEVVAEYKQKLNKLKACVGADSSFTAVLSRHNQTLEDDVGSKHHTAYLHNHTVVYDSVITNTDGAYSPTDGTFRCRTAGTYAFSVSTVIHSQMESCLSLVKNAERVTSTMLDRRHKKGYQAATMSAVLTLEQGDLVRVQPCVDKTCQLRDNAMLFTGHDDTYAVQRQRMNSFSGFLLKSNAC